MSKVVSRGVSAASGMLGGALAGVIFKQVWKLASGKDDAPQANSEEYGWGEVLLAAAVQGAIFGVVKAAIDRSAARSLHRATGQ
ncbi:membrane protein [Planobispora longispora]|uniref:Membrane protein n=2 Tax=Planobispora longispora TaxID=28887 RepID=A0A8J3W787_9ACTN|nr:membrane protein [Planobispora longispora]